MLLRTLKVVRLHGKLNLDINFNEDITLFVGINGSGKTSALNVIDWLLRPNLKKLTFSKYSALELNFDVKDVNYHLKATQENNLLTFSITSPSFQTPLAPITVRLQHVTFDLAGDDETHTGIRYDSISLEGHEMPMWDLLKTFPHPTIITLERTISAETDDVLFVHLPNKSPQKSDGGRTPIRHVQHVMSEKYSEYRAQAIEHDNELKARILMSALQDPMTAFDQSTFQPMSPDEITRLEGKVIKHLSKTINADDVTKHVRQFFKSSKQLSQRLLDSSDTKNFVEAFMLMQYRQIENLAKAFNDLEVKNAAAYANLKTYLDAINKFYDDSGKILYFDETTNQLVFSFLDEYDQSNRRKRAQGQITNLSSGEQQILILFTFLNFVAKSGSVFIVDEPELSLHPKWQHEFMKAFLRLRPKSTQLILATHSPDIVGDFKASCVPLRKPAHG